jgi:metal-sulfur cluster biosynthetic enzyme/Fe-S cluster assembly iron-binding protein IscA
MAPRDPPPSRPPEAERAHRGPLILEVSEAAASQLRSALADKPADFAVRLFVGGGAHPAVGMSVDRVSERDLRVEVGGIPFAVDPGSRPFLDEARVDYLSTAQGSGFSVTGPNAPAPAGADEAPSAPPPATADGSFDAAARAALKKVYDPEIPMNIVDLGLVYALELSPEGVAKVRITLTTPGCPVIDMLLDQVRGAVAALPGVASVDVDVVWDPPWSPERMSEFAKRQLGFA